jgi:hypothetical protein
MTGSAWESLLNRTRARRGRLCGDEPECVPEPAPAHELVCGSIARIVRGGGAPLPLPADDPLIRIYIDALMLAHSAEAGARLLSTPWSVQYADEALSFALRVAARIAAQPYPRDREGP